MSEIRTHLWMVGVLALAVMLLFAGSAVASDPALPPDAAALQDTTSWSSGWVDIAPGETRAFIHDLGGDPALYAVDLWFRDTRSPGFGVHRRTYGGMDVAGQRYGVQWQNLTSASISVVRQPDDVAVAQVRLRIWIPDPLDYDSNWVDIQPGQVITLTHNLGGSADEYTVGIKLRDTSPGGRGIHQYAMGGLEAGGVFHGAAWQSLTDATIRVWRFAGDLSVHQVRVFIRRSDPPDYDSGWVDVTQGETRTFTHDLGGNLNGYVVRPSARATAQGGPGINTRAAGGLEASGQFYGANWESLTDTSINFFRRPHDTFADQVRVRIWRPEYRVYLSLVAKGYPPAPEQELAYDDGAMDTNTSWETGKGFAVRFTPPTGQARLMRARYYLQDPRPIEVHVWDENRADLITPFTAATDQDGWNDVDLSAYTITVSGDFYVGFFHLEDYRPALGVDTTSADGRSFEVDGAYWQQQTSDYMIRAVVVEQ